MKPLLVSERWLSEALESRGFVDAKTGSSTLTHEPDMGAKTRVDYVVVKNGQKIGLESKEFESFGETAKLLKHREKTQATGDGETVNGVWVSDPTFITSNEEFGTLRNAVFSSSGKQLNDLKDQGFPLALVLSSPKGSDVDLDPDEIGYALYGNPIGELVAGTIKPEGGPGTLEDYPHVSAIIVMQERLEAEDAYEQWFATTSPPPAPKECRGMADTLLQAAPGSYYTFQVLHTKAALAGECPRVDDSLFDGPRDEAWDPDYDGNYHLTRPAAHGYPAPFVENYAKMTFGSASKNLWPDKPRPGLAAHMNPIKFP